MDRLSRKPLRSIKIFLPVLINFSLTQIANERIIKTHYGYPRVLKIAYW